MELLSGIHLIEKARGANCYLVINEEAVLVVDTGMPGSAEPILEYAQSLGINPDKVAYIVLTHADIDHSGSAADLKDLTGARIAIHDDDARCLDGTKEPKTVKGFFGILFKVLSLVIRFRHVEPDIILRDENEIGGFKVIHTPGHTDGSIWL